MNDLNEKRNRERVFAVLKILSLEKEYLGYSYDINEQGLKIIVPNSFPEQAEYEFILHESRQDNRILPKDIQIKVRSIWRSSFDEEFDRIGGKIVEVDSSEQLEKLIENYETQIIRNR